jgi:hypothetical protein
MAYDHQASWSARIARDFPDGAVCTWDRTGESPVIYMVPRIEVAGIEGLDPLVKLIPLDMSRVLGPLKLLSYSLAPGPWPPGTRRVTFDNEADAMFWNPKVPQAMKAHGLAETIPET